MSTGSPTADAVFGFAVGAVGVVVLLALAALTGYWIQRLAWWWQGRRRKE